MSGVVRLPVWLGVGDSEPVEVGFVEAGSVQEAQAAMPDFLRQVADAIELVFAAHQGGAAGG